MLIKAISGNIIVTAGGEEEFAELLDRTAACLTANMSKRLPTMQSSSTSNCASL
jgi:hypothetical protein